MMLCTHCYTDAWMDGDTLHVVHQPTCGALTNRGFHPPPAWPARQHNDDDQDQE